MRNQQNIVIAPRNLRTRALSDAEVAALLAKAPSERADIYRFSLLSGARYSAVVDLKVSDVDLAGGIMRLERKKSQESPTYAVSIRPTLKPILKRLMEGKAGDDHVFHMMPREDAARLLREDCKAAEVETTNVDFHCLRRTFITNLARANTRTEIAIDLAGYRQAAVAVAEARG